jgi:hypothetical protein
MISQQCLDAQVLGLGVILLLLLRFAVTVYARYFRVPFSLRSSRFFSSRNTALLETLFPVS